MTTRRVLAAILTAAALVLTAGCGADDTTTTPDATSTFEIVSAPSPDADQSATLLAALGAIDASLDEGEKSVSRARSMCESVLRYDETGEAHPVYSLEDLVRMRFTADDLTDEQALAVVDAIRVGDWCTNE